MNLLSKYLRGRTNKQTTMKIRKYLFYGMSMLLIPLIAAQSIDYELYYLMIDSDQNRARNKKNKYLNEGIFRPTLFLPTATLQHFYFKYFSTRIYLKNKIIQTDACQIISVPLHHLKQTDSSQVPIVYIISGSGGFDHNMMEAMLRAHNNKFELVGIIPKNLDDYEKFAKELKQLKKDKLKRKHYAIGMQYGANLLVNAVSFDPTLFDGIISLANPLDLKSAQKNIENSWINRHVYQKDLIKGLLKFSQDKQASTLEEAHLKLSNVQPDHQEQWLLKHSSLFNIAKLTIPALFIQSKVDPLCISFQKQNLPEEFFEQLENPNCIFVQTRFGGHNLWYGSLNTTNWAFLVAMEHIRVLHRELSAVANSVN